MQVSRKDIANYIGLAKINYPKQYGNLGDDDTMILIESWYDVLKGLSVEICNTAVRRAMANNKYGLNIACVKEQIDLLYQTKEPSAEEQWARLREDLMTVSELAIAIRYDFGDRAEAARDEVRRIYAALPEELKSYVGGTVEAFYGMAGKDEDFYDYEKGRFIRAYPSLKAREKTKTEMTPRLAELVGEAFGIEQSGTLAIEPKRR